MRNQSQTPMEPEGDARGLYEQLRAEVVGGLLYCHDRANTNTGKNLEVMAFAYALIELLLGKGVLTEAELNERKRQVAGRLVEKLKDNGIGVMLQQPEIDKYTFAGGARIDCENRVHLCKAACCRLRFALSKQDLEEGIVKWDLAHPYLIARETDGYCRHFERRECRCTVYQHRPIPCRAYDCRNDDRIWADFANRIVSPELETLFQTPGAAEMGHHDS
jgi:Predicted Fe-S-cluster oxidoreductase